ncbi:MAG: ion transporter [Schleiferiaceae bacterium]|jgi:voltage-gated potassium channel|nr:ion transporter [Schleiferiaceae bacterium]
MATTRERIHEIIFEADTRAGKAFDIALLVAIILSVVIVMLESVRSLDARFAEEFDTLEWVFTGLFTLEYLLRIYVTNKPLKYIFSFYGIIDLLSIVPSYIGLFVGGAESLLVIRSLRLLRIFRVLKLTRYVGESNQLISALIASRRKILVFLFAVLAVTIIMGTAMYLIEGRKNGFDSIPHSIYWAIVTLTTVGYGDISPHTWAGQLLASIIMILGYGIIAVPTGIVTSEMTKKHNTSNTKVCQNCNEDYHLDEAKYCHHCGKRL